MIILILNDPSSITHLDIRRLVQQRFSEIEDCQAILVELGDSIAALEQAIEWPIRHNLFNDTHYGNEDFVPSFEALEDHGYCYEMVFVFSDDGGLELFIPKTEGIDAELLAFCASHSTKPLPTPIDSLVAEVVNKLDEAMREAFEERAAIIEFDANLPRDHAECLALLGLLIRHPAQK